MSEQIIFIASVYKVSTLADGGIRITLDMPETAIEQAAKLMECKRVEIALQTTMQPVELEAKAANGTGTIKRRSAKQRER